MNKLDTILLRRAAIDTAFIIDSLEWCDTLSDAYEDIWRHATPEAAGLLSWFINETGGPEWMNLPETPEWFQEGNPEFYADILTVLAIAECDEPGAPAR